MTHAELYTLYRRAYQDYDRVHGSALALAPRLSAIACAIAELAEADAQDGRPLRTRTEFERCLVEGAGALAPLGLRAA
jgi:hypothetical protein